MIGAPGASHAAAPETGKSLREIGRELAKEIEKIFEAKVKPGTLTVKAHRMQAVTNVTPNPNPQYDNEIQKNQRNQVEVEQVKIEQIEVEQPESSIP